MCSHLARRTTLCVPSGTKRGNLLDIVPHKFVHPTCTVAKIDYKPWDDSGETSGNATLIAVKGGTAARTKRAMESMPSMPRCRACATTTYELEEVSASETTAASAQKCFLTSLDAQASMCSFVNLRLLLDTM